MIPDDRVEILNGREQFRWSRKIVWSALKDPAWFTSMHSLTSPNTLSTYSLHSNHSGLFVLPQIQTFVFPVGRLHCTGFWRWPGTFSAHIHMPGSFISFKDLFIRISCSRNTAAVSIYLLPYFVLSTFYHPIFVLLCLPLWLVSSVRVGSLFFSLLSL